MQLVGKAEGRVPKRVGGPNVILVRESLRKEISFDEFVRLARFANADMKIGRRTLKLEKEYLEAFRNFVLLMEQEGLEF